ncbi:MAG: FAD-binding oxidoreductase [Puniceicoccales bacterium]|jgi:glycine/D-amino acid oxidase-like deaminating enzyme|nr:FAD-binding oxidoreductase [Puniceicoccales bacterium]
MPATPATPGRIVDFLIIGQGLAGTFLARALIERGSTVLVIDDMQRDSSSRVAAGLLNPVTGMRLRFAEGTPELLEISKKHFARLAREHGREIFTPIPIRRLYGSAREKKLKARRETEPGYGALLSPDEAPAPAGSPNPPDQQALADELGSFLIHGGGWVDLPLLLDLEAGWLRGHGALAVGNVKAEDLQTAPDAGPAAILWNGILARKGAVFCNGHKAGASPRWEYLPWQPARGEIIDCQTDVMGAPWILNRAGWAIPLGNGIWRSGSSWEWSPAAFELPPRPELASRLLGHLQSFFRAPVNASLVRHHAGVRPCVLGNEPFCGTHPRHPGLHLFGGLGPKGTLWGPACALHLAALLLEGTPLPARFDLRRIPHP